MSRHSITADGRTFVYGFDFPLETYFWQVWRDGECGDSNEVSGVELVEVAEQWGVTLPEGHMSWALLDLPIPDVMAEGGKLSIEAFDDAWVESVGVYDAECDEEEVSEIEGEQQ